jgi:hypothetical protein
MNIMLIQCSMPALLAQPPTGQHCVCGRWRHRDRAPDTARTSLIDSEGVTGSWLGGTLTTAIEQHARPARLESP